MTAAGNDAVFAALGGAPLGALNYPVGRVMDEGAWRTEQEFVRVAAGAREAAAPRGLHAGFVVEGVAAGGDVVAFDVSPGVAVDGAGRALVWHPESSGERRRVAVRVSDAGFVAATGTGVCGLLDMVEPETPGAAGRARPWWIDDRPAYVLVASLGPPRPEGEARVVASCGEGPFPSVMRRTIRFRLARFFPDAEDAARRDDALCVVRTAARLRPLVFRSDADLARSPVECTAFMRRARRSVLGLSWFAAERRRLLAGRPSLVARPDATQLASRGGGVHAWLFDAAEDPAVDDAPAGAWVALGMLSLRRGPGGVELDFFDPWIARREQAGAPERVSWLGRILGEACDPVVAARWHHFQALVQATMRDEADAFSATLADWTNTSWVLGVPLVELPAFGFVPAAPRLRERHGGDVEAVVTHLNMGEKDREVLCATAGGTRGDAHAMFAPCEDLVQLGLLRRLRESYVRGWSPVELAAAVRLGVAAGLPLTPAGVRAVLRDVVHREPVRVTCDDYDRLPVVRIAAAVGPRDGGQRPSVDLLVACGTARDLVARLAPGIHCALEAFLATDEAGTGRVSGNVIIPLELHRPGEGAVPNRLYARLTPFAVTHVTQAPAVGTIVEIAPPDAEVSADLVVPWQIEGVPPGVYVLDVGVALNRPIDAGETERRGFRSAAFNVVLGEGDHYTRNFTLLEPSFIEGDDKRPFPAPVVLRDRFASSEKALARDWPGPSEPLSTAPGERTFEW